MLEANKAVTPKPADDTNLLNKSAGFQRPKNFKDAHKIARALK